MWFFRCASLSLSLSAHPSEIVLLKIWASIAAVVGPVCCCTFFGCFWLLLTIFWIEFVNKQIKAKDHIKRRQYCICTQQPSTSSQCTRNMPHGVSWWHLAPAHKIHTSCYIKWCDASAAAAAAHLLPYNKCFPFFSRISHSLNKSTERICCRMIDFSVIVIVVVVNCKIISSVIYRPKNWFLTSSERIIS